MTLDAYLEDVARNLPSLVVLLVVEGEERYSFLHGFADREAQRAPTLDTLYGLGSVSKTYAAQVVQRVADPQQLAAPLIGAEDVKALDNVTVHHLLTHTSGLPPLDARYHALDRAAPDVFGGGTGATPPPAADPPPPGHGFTDHRGLVEYLASLEITPIGTPGERLSYSNEGYVLLSGVVEALTGRPFMETVDAAFIGASHDGVEAVPYHAGAPVQWWDAPAWAAPGGVLASARDLAAFATTVDDVNGYAEYPATGARYGYGLLVDEIWGGRRRHGHRGGRVGTSAVFSVVPDERAVVVALSNVSGAPLERAANAALAWLFGLPVDARPPSPADLPEYTLGDRELVRLARTYTSAEGGNTSFVVSEGRLAIGRQPLKAVGPDWVVAGDTAARFIGDGDEPPWGVHLGMRVMTREPAVRRRA